jgi:site-specific DNA recombinase
MNKPGPIRHDTSSPEADGPTLPVNTRAAVSYLRVSTKEQAAGGGQYEGFSIPAQRLANQRKASGMGAVIVAEFIDAGESARKADRPQLQAMLEYVREHPISFCIVHKVDRLARNRVDDVEINVALTRAGVKLVSASENIDETPSGMLLHGIMSTIAEFYSRNLATEVSKGMTQKAVSGGTVARAPIGYKKQDALGREYRTIEVDEARVGHVKWAFESYATGDWSLSMLQEKLAHRGLRTRPTPKIPAKPLEIANLHKMLRNAYYVGDVIYRGVTYKGNHEQIIDHSTWDRVQLVLTAHNTAGDRQREHEHYLKGSVYCGSCGSRLMITMAKNAQGVVYDYFVCLGRHRKRTDCTRQAMRVDEVERSVERAWRRLKLTHSERREVETLIRGELDELAKRDGREQSQFEVQQQMLLAERGKLLTAHYADAIPLDLLKLEQARISTGLAIVNEQLEGFLSDSSKLDLNIETLLNLLQHCDLAYASGSGQTRRLLNQAFADKIYIDEDGDARMDAVGVIDSITSAIAAVSPSRLHPRTMLSEEEPPPVRANASLTAPRHIAKRNSRSLKAAGVSFLAAKPLFREQSLNRPFWVDPRRFELLTSSMRTRRATNCAKGPFAA